MVRRKGGGRTEGGGTVGVEALFFFEFGGETAETHFVGLVDAVAVDDLDVFGDGEGAAAAPAYVVGFGGGRHGPSKSRSRKVVKLCGVVRGEMMRMGKLENGFFCTRHGWMR